MWHPSSSLFTKCPCYCWPIGMFLIFFLKIGLLDCLIYVFILVKIDIVYFKMEAFRWPEMKIISYLQKAKGPDGADEGWAMLILLVGYTPSFMLISMKLFVWPPGQCPWNPSDSLVKSPHRDKLSYWYNEWWSWLQSACVHNESNLCCNLIFSLSASFLCV